jgi:hypothetical protein
MKKKIILILFTIIVTLSIVAFLLPADNKGVTGQKANCSANAVSRLVSNKSYWEKWWPNKSNATDRVFSLNDVHYQVGFSEYYRVRILIINNNDTLNSVLTIFPQHADTTLFNWEYTITPTNNPIKKAQHYFLFKTIKKNNAYILNSMKRFFETQENVYGFNISIEAVTDSLLITTKRTFLNVPTVVEVDEMIQQLKKYCTQKNAAVSGYPMLYYFKTDSGYETMVALPINKEISNSASFIFKRMLGRGNILKAVVKGGDHTINTGLVQLENYKSDYQKISPAIPFQSLITDRTKESDTLKWITNLYYPVLY